MKLMALLFFISFAMLANASGLPDGEYKCDVEPKGKTKPATLKFKVKAEEVECFSGDGEPGTDDFICHEWFKFSSDDFWLDGLYDGGYEYNANGDWEVFADSDGCNVAELILYKNSGFTKGFLTSRFSCSSFPTYTNAGKVSCTIK